MEDMLRWSIDHGDYPVTMTWAFLGGNNVQVDLFTMSDRSMGSFGYAPLEESAVGIDIAVRQEFTDNAIGRGALRAERLFETAPEAPIREPRRLFGKEVRGDWVTADLFRPSNVRLFLGAMDSPIPSLEVRTARSRKQRVQTVRRRADEYEIALSDRLLIVVARSENPEPEWSRVEALVERGESDG
jgi:hypothetical protein